MTNYNLVADYVRGSKASGHNKSGSISFAGKTLWSYNTPIAVKAVGKDKREHLVLMTHWHTRTTQKILIITRQCAYACGLDIVEVPIEVDFPGEGCWAFRRVLGRLISLPIKAFNKQENRIGHYGILSIVAMFNRFIEVFGEEALPKGTLSLMASPEMQERVAYAKQKQQKVNERWKAREKQGQ